MVRVLAFDAGFNLGYGALGNDKPVVSGSRRLDGNCRSLGKTGRHADRIIREIIFQERPGLIAFATPFVGQITAKPQFIGGQPVWGKAAPVSPDALRPLMGILFLIETIADELRIRCVEVEEPQARRAFLTAVPRKSAQIKDAVMRGCRLRGWPCTDNHAGDALCIASFALELVDPRASHTMTPLFAAANPNISKKRKEIRS